MPENPIPVTKTEAGGAAGEFNFANSDTETPRIKKRTLKPKPAGLIKPAVPAAARELEREAPPLSTEAATKIAAAQADAAKAAPVAKAAPIAPPRTTPTTSAPVQPAPKTAAQPVSTASTTSPHGTRPATLYYSTNTRTAETPSPMKTIPTTSAATASSSSSATAVPTSVTRPATTASRPAPTVDYRANVERQSREQKSVGSILSYIVYALIAFFVLSAALAGYGAHVIFKQLGDQSVTVSDLDKKYAAANVDLLAKLSTTQDTLTAAQAQIARQQELIVKQQETLNQLVAASTANDAAIKAEKASRAQDTANLRAKVKELDYRISTQKY